jgi:hypothetical protein
LAPYTNNFFYKSVLFSDTNTLHRLLSGILSIPGSFSLSDHRSNTLIRISTTPGFLNNGLNTTLQVVSILMGYIPLIANQFLPRGRHLPTLYAAHREIFPFHHEK